MNKLGKFELIRSSASIEYKVAGLDRGYHSIGDHFISINENSEVEWVVEKTCDHAGGRLIMKGDSATCPLHGWKLNFNKLKYENGTCKKKIDFQFDKEAKTIVLENPKRILCNPFKIDLPFDDIIEFRWLNHASVWIKYKGITLVTDPWLIGPAFLTGWWLQSPSPEDSIELLKNADYIFVSHNHPDHLHSETLSLLPNDKKIIVGNFQSKSTEKYLKNLGFVDVIPLDFLSLYSIGDNFNLSVIKSGDFRDDSGLYLQIGNMEFLFTVDSNYLNSYVLPDTIDFLFTSFAGGASGFPLCYDTYTEAEKKKILLRNQRALQAAIVQYIQATKPSYYFPYAGMFDESAPRDKMIQENNSKNSVADIFRLTENFGVKNLYPDNCEIFSFSRKSGLTSRKLQIGYLSKSNPQLYINEYKRSFKLNWNNVIDYFKESGFIDNQILQIIFCDDDFKTSCDKIVYCDFSVTDVKTKKLEELIMSKPNFKVMTIKVREEVFAATVEHMLPWEDMSIGFQIRVNRYPNVYEADFWYHFTNIYVNEINFRYSPLCGSCTILDQNQKLIL